MAYVDSAFEQVVLHNLRTGTQIHSAADLSSPYGPVLWADDHTVVLSYADGSLGWFDGDDGHRERAWAPASHAGIVYLNWSRDGDLITVDTTGVIRVRARSSGAVTLTWRPPAQLGKITLAGDQGQVSVDSDLRYVAFAAAGRVVDLKSDHAQVIGPDVRTNLHAGIAKVGYAGEHLLVIMSTTLEIRNASGSRMERSVTAASGAMAAPSPMIKIRGGARWGTLALGSRTSRSVRGLSRMSTLVGDLERRLPLFGQAAALVDTTYVTNAVDALVAAVDWCQARLARWYAAEGR